MAGFIGMELVIGFGIGTAAVFSPCFKDNLRKFGHGVACFFAGRPW